MSLLKPLYRMTPLAQEMYEVFKERTEPKLPTIQSDKLVVLPWDWELPSTILKSSWARKHKQCTGSHIKIFKPSADKIEKEFCAQGLLAHYFGWDGDYHIGWDGDYYINIEGEKILVTENSLTMNIFPNMVLSEAPLPIKDIIPLNDRFRLNYGEIGSILSKKDSL